MTFHVDRAYSGEQFRKKHPESFCDSFWLASENVTAQLGTVFARALSLRGPDEMAAHPSLRIGLAGPSDSGKSTFIKGFMSVFPDAEVLEESTQMSAQDPIEPTLSWFAPFYSAKLMTQSLVLSKEAGVILQRDALWNKTHEASSLLSLDFMHRYGNPDIELVEHPHADDNKDFDIMIVVENKRDLSLSAIFDENRNFGAAKRALGIFAENDIRDSAYFRTFQERMKPFSTNTGLA